MEISWVICTVLTKTPYFGDFSNIVQVLVLIIANTIKLNAEDICWVLFEKKNLFVNFL